MQEASAVEEHLRVIRSLMERGTSYRAISAQAALVGGINSVAAAILARLFPGQLPFVLLWGTVLLVAASANFYFLYGEAVKRGSPFFSAGMKMALKAMAPPLLVGAALTLLLYAEQQRAGVSMERGVVLVWVVIYGLALLATSHFAPRSLSWLGWAFLLLFLAILDLEYLRTASARLEPSDIMGLAFGGFHLLYAACTWPRQRRMTDAYPAEI